MKRLYCFVLAMVCQQVLWAQALTVEKIMQDPKWMGTQPSKPVWSADGKYLYFMWNPDKNIADSTYRYVVTTGKIEKANYNDMQLVNAMKAGDYNQARTKMVFAYLGDIWLYDTKTNNNTRLTQTTDVESAPAFIRHDEWIAYNRAGNFFALNPANGLTQQVTNFSSGVTTVAAPATGRANSRTGNLSDTGNRASGKGGQVNQQETWLTTEALDNSEVLKQRKEKVDARAAFLKQVKDPDTIKTIQIGEKTVRNLRISPSGNYIVYNLYTAPTPSKRTIVPDYVTESGFTTDINGRTKVGNTLGKFEMYVYDRIRDTVWLQAMDNLEGISTPADYEKDYPEKYAGKKSRARAVAMQNVYWNDDGSKAIINIESDDYKDRWLMLLDASNGSFSLIDHQRDEAWIAGPGIGGNDFTGSGTGWINNTQLYFQSEATGYSHLYVYDISTHKKSAITSGNYEVQKLSLGFEKKYFYLLTNEEHPGKQNWYHVDIDGKNKQKITSQTGGYQVTLSPDEQQIAYLYSYMNKPWELYVQANSPSKKPVQLTDKSMSPEWKQYAWREPQMVEITARDGGTIYARLYEPEPSKKNGAAVVFVHGAGYLQNVHYWWSSYFREYMFNNLLTDLGYTVIDADYRASSGYGRNWRTGIYRYMGDKDLTDNIDAINWLVKNKGIDAGRVGMYGGSYGGFITLMALFTTPDVVKAGAALRPVTDWAHYNHEYTARILNEPFTDSIAYARSSPINFASGLKNNLLICHGMLDINVNFQDVVRLTQRLIELGKDNWSVAPYPLEDHGFVEPSSWTDEYKRILKLFNENLLLAK